MFADRARIFIRSGKGFQAHAVYDLQHRRAEFEDKRSIC